MQTIRQCRFTIVQAVISLLILSSGVSAHAQTTEPWSGTYLYDGAGNTKAIGANHFVYDGVSRLRQSTAITAAQQSIQYYAYDAFGNLRSTTTDNAVLAVAVDPATGRIDKIDGCPANATCYAGTFDEAGNQISFGSTSYAFDSTGSLTELNAINRHQFYLYDTDDERIASIDYGGPGNQTAHYTPRDLAQKVTREVDDTLSGGTHSFAWKKDYVYRVGNLLSAVTPSATGEANVDFHLDYLGSPRLITDGHGRRLAAHTYWAFGAEAAGGDVDGETMKFTGHERDASGDGNNLDYMHARYYSSVGGRFLSVDPKSGRKEQPQSWNRYAYVLNNPLTKIDLTGKDDAHPGVRDVLILQVKVGYKTGVEAGPVNVGFEREVRANLVNGNVEGRFTYSAKVGGAGPEGGVRIPIYSASGGALPDPPNARGAVGVTVANAGVKADTNGNVSVSVPVAGTPVSVVAGVNVANAITATEQKSHILEALSGLVKTAVQFFAPAPEQKDTNTVVTVNGTTNNVSPTAERY